MSSTPVPTQYVREQTTTILDIPLDDEAGQDVVSGGLTTLTATMTSLDTGLVITGFEDRDVKSALTAGVLALELTPADLTKVHTREIERRVVTLSATYATGNAWHLDVPVEIRDVVGV